MKFKPLNTQKKKKVVIDNIHIKATRIKKNNKSINKKSNSLNIDNNFSLINGNLSSTFNEEVNSSILNYISNLPVEVKILITNANLKRFIGRPGEAQFHLDNKVYIKITHKFVSNKNFIKLIVKQNKKEIININLK